MVEFGHNFARFDGVCIDGWGSGPFLISVGGKAYRFEDSDRFGPFVMNKDNSISTRQPGGRSPFWKAHRVWKRQGRRTEDDGITCVLDPLKPTKYRVVHGVKIIVEGGDEDGGDVEVKEAEH